MTIGDLTKAMIALAILVIVNWFCIYRPKIELLHKNQRYILLLYYNSILTDGEIKRKCVSLCTFSEKKKGDKYNEER